MSRITTLPEERIKSMWDAWRASAKNMFDNDRTFEAFCVPIAGESNTFWYTLPDEGYLILRGVAAGMARAQFITQDGTLFPNRPATFNEFREAVKEHNLRRVSLLSPSNVPWRDYKLLGFHHEGRLRRGILYNGEWSDVELLGALDHEVGVSKKRFRKRRKPQKRNNYGRPSSK